MSKKFIQIEHLKKRYGIKPSDKIALNDVTLDIHHGEILALLGVNGAGKTTLSSIVAGLHPPTSGSILCEGKSIYDDITTYRKKIGFCPQKPNLDNNLTLEENLFYAGRYYGLSQEVCRERTESLLERFDLQPYKKKQAVILSGGYKQRFLIARSLIHKPELVILDEPTVGLDPHIRKALWKEILEMKENNTTVLLTTHYLDEAEVLSDRVCIIDAGVVKVIETPEQLKKHHKLKSLEEVFLKLMNESVTQVKGLL